MLRLLQSSVGRLRLAGYLEGTSFLLLLGIAMPLKYLAGHPGPVHVFGMAHGIFFLLYVWAVITTAAERRWPMKTMALLLLAALLPFGPFYTDTKLLRRTETPATEN